MKKLSLAIQSMMIAIGMVGIAHADNNNWTGLYVGVNAGVAFNDTQLNSQQLGFTNPSETCNKNSNFSTFFSGIHLGYLYQFTNSFVAGIEANTNFNANQKNRSNCNSEFNSNVYDGFIFKNPLQAAIKVRVGRKMMWNKNRLLPYLTAGASFANLGLKYKNEGGDYYSHTTTQSGWLIGCGMEWAFMQHWSLRAEYYFVNYGNAINLNIPKVYGLLDTKGKGRINLKSNNLMLAINYWI